jgi:hypothetical protein
MSNPVQSETLNLPIPVIDAVLQAASKETLSITEVEEEMWPDTCLGLGGPGEVCAQMQVPGYKVTVAAAGAMFLFYRTDKSGSQVRLEKKTPISP